MTFKVNHHKCRNCGHEGKYHHESWDWFASDGWCEKCNCKEYKDPLKECGVCHEIREIIAWNTKLEQWECGVCYKL